jgi:hypothetical protein
MHVQRNADAYKYRNTGKLEKSPSSNFPMQFSFISLDNHGDVIDSASKSKSINSSIHELKMMIRTII